MGSRKRSSAATLVDAWELPRRLSTLHSITNLTYSQATLDVCLNPGSMVQMDSGHTIEVFVLGFSAYNSSASRRRPKARRRLCTVAERR